MSARLVLPKRTEKVSRKWKRMFHGVVRTGVLNLRGVRHPSIPPYVYTAIRGWRHVFLALAGRTASGAFWGYARHAAI